VRADRSRHLQHALGRRLSLKCQAKLFDRTAAGAPLIEAEARELLFGF